MGYFQLAVLKGPCAGRQHLVIFNQNIGASSELERFLPPSLKLVIVNDLIIDELEVVRGNGEQQRHIERLENIIFYQHIAMIVIPLPVQLLDFRVNGNDGIRKLVTRGQVVNEMYFCGSPLHGRRRFHTTPGHPLPIEWRSRRNGQTNCPPPALSPAL